MKGYLLTVIFFIASSVQSFAQAPLVKMWDKRFGGYDRDNLTSIQQTADGGYILGGYSDSPAGVI